MSTRHQIGGFAAALWMLLAVGRALAEGQPSPDKVPSTRDFSAIRRQVETLRGLKFRREVPVYRVSEQELRAIAAKELDEAYPGQKLPHYEELLAWLDMVPPQTDLKSVYADFLVDQVAGLYDSEAKEMCIPSFAAGTTNQAKRAAEKKLEQISDQLDDIVLAHEFTHALEDQYWPIDDPQDRDLEASTDRGTAHGFLLEGSATREMIECVPAQWGQGSVGRYFLLWNMIHSGLGELVLNYALGNVWKSPEAVVEGVPDALSRTEAMPYSFGYAFCTELMRQWGLDGLDYIYNHPPVSSAQVMHPQKSWEWRDLPVQIHLPESLPGGWEQVSVDSVGEAGLAVLLGCQFKNLDQGLRLARGWDGDQVALFGDAAGHRLLLWASSWETDQAASRFVSAWFKERERAHQATVIQRDGTRITWQSPSGRAGSMRRSKNRVILLESDDRAALSNAEASVKAITFAEPPEDAVRNAANSPLRRHNPIWSWQRDGDYTVSRTLGGLLWRHDQNAVGVADRILLGWVGERRQTASFNKWGLGGGLLARHEAEARRGTSKTTLLPWGCLASHSSARLPQTPNKTIARTSVFWGLGATATLDEAGCQLVEVLPFGLLVRHASSPARSSFHILGTGVMRVKASDRSTPTTRVRLLGIPIWTTRAVAPGGG